MNTWSVFATIVGALVSGINPVRADTSATFKLLKSPPSMTETVSSDKLIDAVNRLISLHMGDATGRQTTLLSQVPSGFRSITGSAEFKYFMTETTGWQQQCSNYHTSRVGRGPPTSLNGPPT